MNAAGLSTTGTRPSAASCTHPISSLSSSVCLTSTRRPSFSPTERHSAARSAKLAEP